MTNEPQSSFNFQKEVKKLILWFAAFYCVFLVIVIALPITLRTTAFISLAVQIISIVVLTIKFKQLRKKASSLGALPEQLGTLPEQQDYSDSEVRKSAEKKIRSLRFGIGAMVLLLISQQFQMQNWSTWMHASSAAFLLFLAYYAFARPMFKLQKFLKQGRPANL